MSSELPTLLDENAGLVFLGEEAWLSAQLTERQASNFESARNPTGRPNSDVLRRMVGIYAGRIVERLHVDFPLHFTEQESALYLEPFGRLRSTQKKPSSVWWLNPNATPALRTALARLERYLVTPCHAENPAWHWIDSHHLPDVTLLAVARDDDFAHGLLQSRPFNLWWRTWSRKLSPLEIIGTFPFPWPPVTLLSSLTREQEEQRHAIARAARANSPDQLDSAVITAYGLSEDFREETLLASLRELNRQRAIR